MTRQRAVIYTISASLLFGLIPFIVAKAYETGMNAFDVLFFRFFFAGILFYFILRLRKETLAITWLQMRILLIMGIVGYVMMNATLFLSYNYLSIGLATTIHFAYPIVVTILAYFFYKQKLRRIGIIALFLATLGIILLSADDYSINSILGLVLSFSSAVFFAAYVLLIAHPEIKSMSPWKILFYVSLLTTVLLFVGELCFGTTPFVRLTGMGCLYMLILSVGCTVVSLALFTLGIKRMGPATACILATLEPITSILLGALFLGEQFNLQIGVGCVFVIVAVVLISLPSKGEAEAQQPQTTEVQNHESY